MTFEFKKIDLKEHDGVQTGFVDVFIPKMSGKIYVGFLFYKQPDPDAVEPGPVVKWEISFNKEFNELSYHHDLLRTLYTVRDGEYKLWNVTLDTSFFPEFDELLQQVEALVSETVNRIDSELTYLLRSREHFGVTLPLLSDFGEVTRTSLEFLESKSKAENILSSLEGTFQSLFRDSK